MEMVCPTCNHQCRVQALGCAVNGITWHFPVKACEIELASGKLVFLKNRICSCGKYLALPICSADRYWKVKRKCLWQMPNMTRKSGANIP